MSINIREFPCRTFQCSMFVKHFVTCLCKGAVAIKSYLLTYLLSILTAAISKVKLYLSS